MVVMSRISQYIAVLIPIILIISCGSQNADRGRSEVALRQGQSIDSIISHIWKEYQTINSDTSLKSKQIDLVGLSTEGGELIALVDGIDLRKAKVTFYGEMGKRIDEYYFENGSLFFLFQQVLSYDKPVYLEGSKIISTEEDRYYFHEDLLIRWIDRKNDIVDPNSEEAIKKVEGIYELVTTIKEAVLSNQNEVVVDE